MKRSEFGVTSKLLVAACQVEDQLESQQAVLALQQYWSRLEPHQFVPVKTFAAAFAKTQLGQQNAADLTAPEEHVPKEGELDPLQRTKCVNPAYVSFLEPQQRMKADAGL